MLDLEPFDRSKKMNIAWVTWSNVDKLTNAQNNLLSQTRLKLKRKVGVVRVINIKNIFVMILLMWQLSKQGCYLLVCKFVIELRSLLITANSQHVCEQCRRFWILVYKINLCIHNSLNKIRSIVSYSFSYCSLNFPSFSLQPNKHK